MSIRLLALSISSCISPGRQQMLSKCQVCSDLVSHNGRLHQVMRLCITSSHVLSLTMDMCIMSSHVLSLIMDMSSMAKGDMRAFTSLQLLFRVDTSFQTARIRVDCFGHLQGANSGWTQTVQEPSDCASMTRSTSFSLFSHSESVSSATSLEAHFLQGGMSGADSGNYQLFGAGQGLQAPSPLLWGLSTMHPMGVHV